MAMAYKGHKNLSVAYFSLREGFFMEGRYGVYAGDQEVGTVYVKREGLYYRFHCECQLAGKDICKVCVRCGGDALVLGTLIPEGRNFVLTTKLPIKRLKEDKPEFVIVTNKTDKWTKFIPIRENEMFLYLKYIKNAVFETHGTIRGVTICEISEAGE